MIHKKSSSIVKWIFIISLLELGIPLLLYLVPSNTLHTPDQTAFNDLGLTNIIQWINIPTYIIILVFIYLFYKNYKNISVDADARTLMKNILKTRKIVKSYVIFGLVVAGLLWAVVSVGVYVNIGTPNSIIDLSTTNADPENFKMAFIFIALILGVIMIGLIGLVYFLLYGILLKKLNRNYKELKKLEV